MPPPSDPARWRETKRLFEAALALPPADRAPFLDAACGAEGATELCAAELRAAVEALLDADAEAETADGFLASAPLALRRLLDGLGDAYRAERARTLGGRPVAPSGAVVEAAVETQAPELGRIARRVAGRHRRPGLARPDAP